MVERDARQEWGTSGDLRGADPPGVLRGGRHRMAPEAVGDHQHARLLAAMASLCAERGYAHVVISDIVARAAVSKGTFYRFFKTKDECIFEAHKYYSAMLLASIDASCEGEDEETPSRLQAGVRAALRHCAASPEAAQLLALGILACGPEGVRRYRVMIEALANRLDAVGAFQGRRSTDAVLAATAFAGPQFSSSASAGESTAILALEDDLVEMILAFAERG